jgi:hypothetical protein
MHTIKKIISLIIISLFIILHTQQVFSYTYSAGKNAYDQKNYAKAFRIWYLLSVENDPNGKFGMGLLYKNGFDQLDPSCEYALQYLSSAEKSGINDASYELGNIFEVGKLCKIDKSKALTYYEKAAKNNHPESIIRLAESYENGTLGLKDKIKSCAYNDQAANLGDAIGQYRSAKCYKYNKAGIRDFDKAFNLLETAVNQKTDWTNDAKLEIVSTDEFNDSELSCEWNEILHQKKYIEGTYETALCLKYNIGGVTDFDKAIKYLISAKDTYGEEELFKVKFQTEEINCDWYQILHQNNYSEATYNFAMCYRYGKGRAENSEEARKLFTELIGGEKTSDQEGKLELSDMCLEGIGGNKDMALAEVLLLSIRDGSNSTDRQKELARTKLAEVDFGWDECKQELDKMDDSKAKQICLKVAEKNQPCAMIKVSELLESGQSGFAQDLTEAKKWKIKADLACGIAGGIHSGYQSCSCD